jgi:rod shape determining protein RodA
MTGVRRNSNNMSLFGGIDWWTVLLYVTLTIIGFVAVFSASYVEGSENAFSFSHEYIKHLFWLGLSYFAGLIILLLDRSIWHKCAYIICGITIFILLLTFTPLGKSVNGARAWLGLGGFTLQPMEFVKVGISLTMARIMSVYGFSVQHVNDMIKALILLFIPMAIAVLQNDTGSGLVFCSFIFMFFREGLNYWICIPLIFLVALLILSFLLTPGVLLIALILIFTFCAGMIMRNRWKSCIKYVVSLFLFSTLLFLVLAVWIGLQLSYYDCLLISTGLSLFVVFAYAYRANIRSIYLLILFFFVSIVCLPTSDMVFHHLKPHQQNRIRTFLGQVDDRDLLYNVSQSKIAIGSGGFAGKGFLKGSLIRYSLVPEKHTDFIFCVVGEEFGFLGALVLFSLFAMLILRLMRMGDRQLETFGRVYCYCVASILFFHCCINIGMTMGIVPVMGIPLPFISYGGSSLLGFSVLVFIAIAIDASPTKYQSTIRKW